MAFVSLGWDASLDPADGYMVRYGTQADALTNQFDAGNSLSATVTNLVQGQLYYFSVTAYAVGWSDSPPSNEISATP